jgi:hypothetical protein
MHDVVDLAEGEQEQTSATFTVLKEEFTEYELTWVSMEEAVRHALQAVRLRVCVCACICGQSTHKACFPLPPRAGAGLGGQVPLPALPARQGLCVRQGRAAKHLHHTVQQGAGA